MSRKSKAGIIENQSFSQKKLYAGGEKDYLKNQCVFCRWVFFSSSFPLKEMTHCNNKRN
jgi:hypothetical protein